MSIHATTDARLKLLSTLEMEVFFCRDLIHLVADHLSEIYPNDIAVRSKLDVRIASTLAIVARDRIDASYQQINTLYGLEEVA